MGQIEKNYKITDFNHTISVTTSNVNGPNTPNKRERLLHWIFKKQDLISTCYCVSQVQPEKHDQCVCVCVWCVCGMCVVCVVCVCVCRAGI